MQKHIIFAGLFILVLGIVVPQCSLKAQEGDNMSLEISSTAFEENSRIPEKYTCEGENVSPPLKWKDAPEGTVTFALIADDPDASMGTWIHWVVFNIPSSINELQEAVAPVQNLDNGAEQGISSFGNTGYGGPCPPPGSEHRYFFKLYALDKQLELEPGVSKQELEQAMQVHILAEAQLIGTYSR